jgi:hypothetical protein
MGRWQADKLSRGRGGRRWLWAALLVAGSAASAWAAELTITAQVDQEQVALEDTVRLTVTVTSEGLRGLDTPNMPPLEDFQVVSTATQSSVSIVNAKVSNSINYIYVLKPRRTGKLTIGSFRITSGRETRSTSPLTVTVTSGGGGGRSSGRMNQPLLTPPGSTPPPFGEGLGLDPDDHTKTAVTVKHFTDRKTAYVGQQITYTFGFYQAEQVLGEVSYSPAATTGFVAEELPNPPNDNTTIDGRQYVVQRRLKALFATTPGKQTIGEASVEITVDPFIGAEQLVAEPLRLTILPLPEEGRPAGFAGAVGRFKLSVQPDRTTLRAGETANLRVQLTGTGNLRSLGPPPVTAPEGVRVYKAGEDRQVAPGAGGGGSEDIGGTVTFDYMVLPRQEGTVKLPGVQYAYFDPASRAYRVLRSEPITLTVQPGSAVLPPEPGREEALQPLKAGPGRPVRPLLINYPALWVVLVVPLVLLGGAGWARWRQVKVAADPAQARADSALRLARRRYEMAEQCLRQQQADACYIELNTALADYVADRTGAPPAGLTAEEVESLLRQAGAEPELATRTRQLLERTAAGRFAPGAGAQDPHRLVAECRDLTEALQRQVRPQREQ